MHLYVHCRITFFFIIIILLNCYYPVQSEIQTIKITSDSRSMILFNDFGFNNMGYISISISSISITTTSLDPENSYLMGFFYAPALARRTMNHALHDDHCVIGQPFIFPILVFNEITVLSQSSFNNTIPVKIPDLYYIFFVNCAQNSSISMVVDLETYNVKPNGDPDYLDDYFTNLPSTLFTFSFLFFVFLLIWSRICYMNKHFLRNIHFLMTILLFLRFLDLLCHAEAQYSMRVSGLPHAWNSLWLVVCFARNILFASVITLIGAGWSLLSPHLSEFQRYMMAIILSLQVVASVCFILMRGLGLSYRHYRYWVLMYYFVDFACCVMMLLPAFKTIDNFDACAKTEGNQAKKWAKLKVFGNYALAIHAYIGFTRLGLLILRCITSYKFLSETIALELAIELLFYIVVYMMFSPSEPNDYFVIGE